MTVLGISGSTRMGSINAKILATIKELYHQTFFLEIFDQIQTLPHFNPEVAQGIVPYEVDAFRNQIERADAILISSPEYIFSMPGALKNALEWTVSTTVFSYKPIGIIVASASGEKAMEELDLVLKTLVQEEIPSTSKLLIKGGRSKVNEGGELKTEVVFDLHQLVNSVLSRVEVRS